MEFHEKFQSVFQNFISLEKNGNLCRYILPSLHLSIYPFILKIHLSNKGWFCYSLYLFCNVFAFLLAGSSQPTTNVLYGGKPFLVYTIIVSIYTRTKYNIEVVHFFPSAIINQPQILNWVEK